MLLDAGCELAAVLEPKADGIFWDLGSTSIHPKSLVILSRQTLNQHADMVRQMSTTDHALPVLVNPTEGSQTMKHQCAVLGLLDVIKARKMLLVGCGDMEPDLPCLWYDCYRYKPYDYDENLDQCERAKETYLKKQKPYTFLFLNGRTRAHRKYLIERLRDLDLLSQSLWTNLDVTPVPAVTNIYGALCDRPSQLQVLPAYYEVGKYRANLDRSYAHRFVKFELFDQDWGEIYLQAEPYIDTYFSLVSETVFEYPYTLRSEKIYKPIAIGHPWIAAASRGFYRDMKQAGFKTFDGLVDESFDLIDDNLSRLERIVAVVEDLCKQDLDSFLQAAQPICEYNQQHMKETAPAIKQAFVPLLEKFLLDNHHAH